MERCVRRGVEAKWNCREKNTPGGKRRRKKKRADPALNQEQDTGIQNLENMRKTGKESITAAEIMKLLPGRRSRKAWRKRMPIL